ncbi:hypothetical protein AAFF_G00260450 [Aldrovandia affinis]|uniref:Uncharacterized protein n=1 Tax=Aldrovandia affinis TaxID=143900 RepID=A0AAD7RCG8_9TELE|nr:hypothetical protein AAFF_G00260450 [Aldrovandia affinis]
MQSPGEAAVKAVELKGNVQARDGSEQIPPPRLALLSRAAIYSPALLFWNSALTGGRRTSGPRYSEECLDRAQTTTELQRCSARAASPRL